MYNLQQDKCNYIRNMMWTLSNNNIYILLLLCNNIFRVTLYHTFYTLYLRIVFGNILRSYL